MTVRSKSTVSFVYDKRRYSSLSSAEITMRSEDDLHSRLILDEKVDTNADEIVYNYVIPLEPWINAGQDITNICGDDTLLDGTITGVSLNQLTIDWEQLSGELVHIHSPAYTDTLTTRDAGDDTDKEFSITVINNETGIFNTDKVRVFSTPTEIVDVEAGSWGSSILDSNSHSSNIWLDIESDLGNPGFAREEDTYIVRYNRPDSYVDLVRVDLLENISGQYIVINQQLNPIEDTYVKILNNREEIQASYKLRFVYEKNNQLHSIFSNNRIKLYNSRPLLALDRDHVLEVVTDGLVANINERRSGVESRGSVEDTDLAMNYGSYKDQHSMIRFTKVISNAASDFDVGSNFGSFSYIADIQRKDKDQIGGG